MSDVVIRCPNCGTTQPTLGECEACHEAQVRYFCPNHSPGLWLGGPECVTCGATFTGRSTHAPPPSSRPIPPAPAPPRAAPRGVPPSGLPPRTSTTAPFPPRRAEPLPPAPPPTRRPTREPEIVADAPWIEIEDVPRRPTAPAWPPTPRFPAEIPIPALRAGLSSALGCLARLAMVALVLFVLGALWFFGYLG